MNKAAQKINRLRQTLSHKEADRIPVGEFFWTGFLKKCQKKWGDDFNPYRHFDLDYITVSPNMDPKIQAFEIIEQTSTDIRLKTGFGATILHRESMPMPHYDEFSVKTPQDMEYFNFDDPADSRRFYDAGDDQINGIGDEIHFNTQPWNDSVEMFKDDFAVFGSVCEPYEYLWRCIGTENALLWMAMEPELIENFVNRIGSFLLRFTEAQINAGKGRLSGMYIWGDVAYRNGMLFGAPRWRELFKPHVNAIIELCHRNNLMVFYHGCGNATCILNDMVEIGLDCYNPLEVKADLDVVDLKNQYSGRLAFCGNVDVRVLERGNPEEIRSHVIYKLQAAKNGGYVFQSDHSVSSDVEPESYELAIRTLREYGTYPLNI